uniref:Uncharacterized protein n=1 Tax=Anguilla anguilla TaxID=7936 RepID=A0A0E9SSM8_ANGAN
MYRNITTKNSKLLLLPSRSIHNSRLLTKV